MSKSISKSLSHCVAEKICGHFVIQSKTHASKNEINVNSVDSFIHCFEMELENMTTKTHSLTNRVWHTYVPCVLNYSLDLVIVWLDIDEFGFVFTRVAQSQQ